MAIVENSPALRLKASTPISLTEMKTGEKVPLTTGAAHEIRASEGAIVVDSRRLSSPVMLLSGGGRLRLYGRLYGGDIILRAENGRLDIIESLPLEDYLCGVLPGEMGAEWPLEALKAQAVASRTFALKQLKPAKDFDITDGVEMQVYKGAAATDPKILRAVRETSGEVLRYRKKLVTAFFHSCCGGHTAGVNSAWGEELIKPLTGVKDKFCVGSSHFRWELFVPARDLLTYLQRQGTAALKIKSLRIHQKDQSGRATSLKFVTDQGSFVVQTKELRKHLGNFEFRSTYLTSVTETRGGWQFEGRGWGHGVGMCQEGAKAMALGGRNYRKILRHYYPSADIQDF